MLWQAAKGELMYKKWGKSFGRCWVWKRKFVVTCCLSEDHAIWSGQAKQMRNPTTCYWFLVFQSAPNVLKYTSRSLEVFQDDYYICETKNIFKLSSLCFFICFQHFYGLMLMKKIFLYLPTNSVLHATLASSSLVILRTAAATRDWARVSTWLS